MFPNSKGVFSYGDILQLLKDNPEYLKINSMHAGVIEVSTAWHTGSYVNEM